MVGVIIPAAGSSQRMGKNKLLLPFGGKTVIERSVAPFLEMDEIGEILIVVSKSETKIPALFHHPKVRVLTQGGETRQETVYRGLQALSEECDTVLIHDGARPFIEQEEIVAVIWDAKETGAAVLGVKAKDTVKTLCDGWIQKTLDRNEIFLAQTPQGFDRKLLEEAFLKTKGRVFTDEAGMVEAFGKKVKAVFGKSSNLKLTTPEDLALAKGLLEEPKMKIGHGYDVHRLTEGRKLILGGVEIPFSLGLLGHSDADVLTHAVIDAIFGALALGDIGAFFPDTDETYRGICSLTLLEETAGIMEKEGYVLGNLDVTVAAQAPKLRPYIEAMRENLARILKTDQKNISVKATTEEGLGVSGGKKGISATAVCLLFLKESQ